MPKCKCGKSACFGHRGEKATCCVSHKEDFMVNVVDALCCSCEKRAMYNLPGKTGGVYCIDHKKDGMINVKGKRCAFVYSNGLLCYTAPIYNIDGEVKGKFCIEHRSDGMVNVTGKRCEVTDCRYIAQYNYNGEVKGKYCSQHREEGMVDVKHRRCETGGCMNQPSYKFENDSSCRFCSLHKLDGMTNWKHAKCNFDGCNKLAGYSEIGIKTPKFCSQHKEDGMVDVKHPLCHEDGCDKRPIFNFKGSKNGLYCVSHKKDNMIDIVSPICKSSWCENYASKNYDKYCIHCFIHLFPDKPIVRNYKTKEKAVADFILSNFDGFTWICDKRVQDGCSRRRPDLLLDMGSHVLVVEVDENQHTEYECSCENKRLMEISQDIGHRPLIFIRFNPDGYIDIRDIKIKSCWIMNKQSGILYVPKIKQTEWDKRLFILKETVEYWIHQRPEKMVEIVQLFYDGTPTN
jgi:hypothetical protein